LLLFRDLDILEAIFNNFQNIFIQKGKYILIIRVYSYPWILLSEVKALIYLNQDLINNITAYYLTKVELRCLYRCFGYFLVRCFHKILEHTSYKTNFEELKYLTKYYE
jgi:hypothetical protein